MSSVIYATNADLLLRYNANDVRKLSDKSGSGQEDQIVLETALRDATAEINSYLSVRYKLPLTTVSHELVRICCVIARYWLEDGRYTDKALEDYQICISQLEELRDGITNLGLSDDDLLPDPADSPVVVIDADQPVWTRKQSTGFI